MTLNPRYGTFSASAGITSALVGDVVNDSAFKAGGSQSGDTSGQSDK